MYRKGSTISTNLNSYGSVFIDPKSIVAVVYVYKLDCGWYFVFEKCKNRSLKLLITLQY